MDAMEIGPFFSALEKYKHIFVHEVVLTSPLSYLKAQLPHHAWKWGWYDLNCTTTMYVEDFNPILHFYPIRWATATMTISSKPLNATLTILGEYYGQHFLD